VLIENGQEADKGHHNSGFNFVEQGGNFAHDPMRSITDGAADVKRYLLT
jgi:hypothetical protein